MSLIIYDEHIKGLAIEVDNKFNDLLKRLGYPEIIGVNSIYDELFKLNNNTLDEYKIRMNLLESNKKIAVQDFDELKFPIKAISLFQLNLDNVIENIIDSISKDNIIQNAFLINLLIFLKNNHQKLKDMSDDQDYTIQYVKYNNENNQNIIIHCINLNYKPSLLDYIKSKIMTNYEKNDTIHYVYFNIFLNIFSKY